MNENKETRARKRIREAVESRGYKLVSLTYEPWYDGGEKSGICGGWYGELDHSYLPNTWPGNEIMGLSVEETLAWIDMFVGPSEPCECPPRSYPDPLRSYVPIWVHKKQCKWFIQYWLKSWGPKT